MYIYILGTNNTQTVENFYFTQFDFDQSYRIGSDYFYTVEELSIIEESSSHVYIYDNMNSMFSAYNVTNYLDLNQTYPLIDGFQIQSKQLLVMEGEGENPVSSYNMDAAQMRKSISYFFESVSCWLVHLDATKYNFKYNTGTPTQEDNYYKETGAYLFGARSLLDDFACSPTPLCPIYDPKSFCPSGKVSLYIY